MEIPEQVRRQLKRPLGEVHSDFRRIRELAKTRRIISIGDICTLSLLAMGIRPHLAVFDFRYMRKELDSGLISILRLNFKDHKDYTNPAGTISEEIIRDAAGLIESGGGVLIEGEEDLTALAFIRSAAEDDVIVYGQPGDGLVIVIPEKEIKEKVEGWLAPAMAL